MLLSNWYVICVGSYCSMVYVHIMQITGYRMIFWRCARHCVLWHVTREGIQGLDYDVFPIQSPPPTWTSDALWGLGKASRIKQRDQALGAGGANFVVEGFAMNWGVHRQGGHELLSFLYEFWNTTSSTNTWCYKSFFQINKILYYHF